MINQLEGHVVVAIVIGGCRSHEAHIILDRKVDKLPIFKAVTRECLPEVYLALLLL